MRRNCHITKGTGVSTYALQDATSGEVSLDYDRLRRGDISSTVAVPPPRVHGSFLTEEPDHLSSMRLHCMVLSSSVAVATLLVLHTHAKGYTLTPSRLWGLISYPCRGCLVAVPLSGVIPSTRLLLAQRRLDRITPFGELLTLKVIENPNGIWIVNERGRHEM